MNFEARKQHCEGNHYVGNHYVFRNYVNTTDKVYGRAQGRAKPISGRTTSGTPRQMSTTPKAELGGNVRRHNTPKSIPSTYYKAQYTLTTAHQYTLCRFPMSSHGGAQAFNSRGR